MVEAIECTLATPLTLANGRMDSSMAGVYSWNLMASHMKVSLLKAWKVVKELNLSQVTLEEKVSGKMMNLMAVPRWFCLIKILEKNLWFIMVISRIVNSTATANWLKTTACCTQDSGRMEWNMVRAGCCSAKAQATRMQSIMEMVHFTQANILESSMLIKCMVRVRWPLIMVQYFKANGFTDRDKVEVSLQQLIVAR